MTTYSDEKNPHNQYLNDCCNDPYIKNNHAFCRNWSCEYRTGTGCYFSNCIESYKEGYLAGEKARFTEEEKQQIVSGLSAEIKFVNMNLNEPYKSKEIASLQALQKKVIGEG